MPHSKSQNILHYLIDTVKIHYQLSVQFAFKLIFVPLFYLCQHFCSSLYFLYAIMSIFKELFDSVVEQDLTTYYFSSNKIIIFSFAAKLDGVKTYMRMRRVPTHLQGKVIKWFDYLWLTQKCSDEEKAVSCLPGKL